MSKIRNIVALSLSSLLIISTANPSLAAEKTPPPAITLSPFEQYELDLIKFKIEFRIYLEARAEREQQLRVIANTFYRALKQAQQEAKSAGRGASSKAIFFAARAAAAEDRDKAVAELEPLMDPPQPPIKPPGNWKKGNKSKAFSSNHEKSN